MIKMVEGHKVLTSHSKCDRADLFFIDWMCVVNNSYEVHMC